MWIIQRQETPQIWTNLFSIFQFNAKIPNKACYDNHLTKLLLSANYEKEMVFFGEFHKIVKLSKHIKDHLYSNSS